MKTIASLILTTLLILFSNHSFGADDPSIKKSLKLRVQEAMTEHINHSSDSNGKYRIFDANNKTVEKLIMTKLHAGVVKKGDLYVSCADFTDKDGTKYDVDFFVASNRGKLKVVEAIVHSKDGKKSTRIEISIADIIKNAKQDTVSTNLLNL